MVAQSTIRIGSRTVGAGHPCFIVAEVGINHNGDMDLAEKAVELAAKSGADAVKFQNYRTEDFIIDKSLTLKYATHRAELVESQWELFKRCELSRDKLKILGDACRRNGVAFISTPTSPEGIDDLKYAGAVAVKNGSDFLTNLPLIRHMARSGLPTIISTGMATLAEIDDAVRAFWKAGGTQLAVLHCVSNYPAAPGALHLRKITALQSVLHLPIGFSDHSKGETAAVAAVALGASLLEKHFTPDKQLPGPDHSFSSDAQEFAAYVRAVRDAELALAEAPVGFSPAEFEARRQWRLSCVAARDLSESHRLSKDDIIFGRPGFGIRPTDADFLIGRSLIHAVPKGHVFNIDDFKS
ncbi:MAG: N-acetylneuraminate synthase family protein [Acidobacteriota bacterium]